MAYYRDLRQHIAALEAAGKLVRITAPINKDTELMALVRWQFRGLPESERRAFLFENVTDAKGRRYDIPVLVASLAASREVYAIGMQCRSEEIVARWQRAQLNPIEAVLVDDGPVHEVVHQGADLERPGGGLDLFPIPISTPGLDNGPYLTAAHWISKDPETGIRNVGNYRGLIKSPTRAGCGFPPTKHIGVHWSKAKKRGQRLEVAVALGVVPSISFAAVTNIPYGTDEFAVAGGLAGEPVRLVKCRTIDIEVPATTEIVFEGYLAPDYFEYEAPFGEYTGYLGGRKIAKVFEVTCITHRRNPIFTQMISQFPPSESSKIRQIGFENVVYTFLQHHCRIPGILDVALHESGGSWQYCVIRMKKQHPAHAWQALNGVMALDTMGYKIVIAVDEDIDPRDADSVNWALSFGMQPHRDVRIVTGRATNGQDNSAYPPGEESREHTYPAPHGVSSLLIDATRKWDYPPVSLPRQEFMVRAKELWDQLGLPPLAPKAPWHGYTLGYWTAELEEEAQLALKGEHYVTGEKHRQQRKTAP